MNTKLERFFTDQGLHPPGTLVHFGIKGMKWGIRRSESQLAGGKTGTTASGVKVATDASGKIITAKGGRLSERVSLRGKNIKEVPLENADAVRARTTLATIKKTKSLVAVSDADLNHLVNRLGLEKRYSEISKTSSPLSKTNKKVKSLLSAGDTMNSAIRFANSDAGRSLYSIFRTNVPKHALGVGKHI